MNKTSSHTALHCAILAALVAFSSNSLASSFLLEGEAVDLTETTYAGDLFGGQYFMKNSPTQGTYFGENGNRLYDELQNFSSTNINIKNGTTVTGEVIGGSWIHTGNYDLTIGTINLSIQGGTTEHDITCGNATNAWGLSSIKSEVREINASITEGSNLKHAILAGSSVKSQLANPQSNDSTQSDHVHKTTLTIVNSTANGIAGGSLTLSADSR